MATDQPLAAGPRTLVMKFGGTSVGSVAAMAQAVQIVAAAQRAWPRLVVVTSALSGVTDQLIESARQAASGNLSVFHRTRAELLSRHEALIADLVSDLETQARVRDDLAMLVEEFAHLVEAMRVLGEASPRAMDAVASLGERLSVRVLSAALAAAGLPTRWVESTRLVITDERFTNAVPEMTATTRCSREILQPLLDEGCIPVVTGFLGATTSGVTTTLGRGGSDYSASILAIALGAAEVWIWTDVDGVMTADPRMVPEARTIPVLSYREVAEMAYYGAKVLHPKSIHPCIEAGIPLRVCNTFRPNGPDTRLEHDETAASSGKIKALAAIRGMKLVTVAGRGMLGVPGVAGRIFSAAATTGISIPLIIESTSEQSISFAAPKEAVPDVLRALQRSLSQEFQRHDIDQATAGEEVDIITVLCPGIRHTPGIAGRIFGTIGDASINVLAIAYGSSDYSISLAVAHADTPSVLRRLHSLVE